ncbi:major facilitator superfamily domain-containing protein [Aspergillus ambiguus]|uniref:major facilitator superfamily domain-containing protein n=1 Tax=Aspergillus ambiguus TaxID=176160 RepID=UPI003CCD7717
MAEEEPHLAPTPEIAERNIEAQSAFASTLVADVEKSIRTKELGPSKAYPDATAITVSTPDNQAGGNAVYAAKARLLNQALMDMGMGRYQWFLFIITSVGWFLDSFWMMSFAVIAPSASNEAMFFYTGDKTPYLFVSLYVGLTIGGTAWPWMSDFLGRKWIFTSTIVLMGMGGLVGAGLPSFTGLCVVGFVVGFAIAGNQVVDAIILLEWVPPSHQFLVAVQSVFWGLGQLVAAAVGWAFIAGYTCGTGPDAVSTEQSISGHAARSTDSSSHSSQSSASCHYVSNKGWRYVWWTFGCITLFLYLCRFIFPLRETPKYLISKRRDAEAVQLVNDIATYGKRRTWLGETAFARIDSTIDASESRRQPRLRSLILALRPIGLPILCLLWAVTGLTFILHRTYISNYLAAHSVPAVTAKTVSRDYLYSRYLYTAICAIPGPLVAGLLVQVKLLGRKRTGAALAVLTGLFMLLATVARSRNALLAFECIISFLQFAEIAVLTLYTVEIFAAPIRGFGMGVMGFFWGLFGLVAMIITTFSGSAVAGGAAVWFSGAIWIIMGAGWLIFPETMGNAAA